VEEERRTEDVGSVHKVSIRVTIEVNSVHPVTLLDLSYTGTGLKTVEVVISRTVSEQVVTMEAERVINELAADEPEDKVERIVLGDNAEEETTDEALAEVLKREDSVEETSLDED
jgi:hypothetical protein